MRSVRFPIAGLMGAVLVVAVGLAALRNASPIWAGAMFLLTCGVLGRAVVGVICRGDGVRAWWLGFALFGWGYLLLAFWSWAELPTMVLLDAIGRRLAWSVNFGGGRGGGGFEQSLIKIGRCLWALVAALLGGFLAKALFGGQTENTGQGESYNPVTAQAARRLYLRLAFLGLSCCVIIVSLGFFWSGPMPGLWLGATFLLTCGLLSITILGVTGSQGKQRQIWLGAALFGVGYMTMAFNRSLDWPSLPTDHLLNAIRHWFPPVITGFPTAEEFEVTPVYQDPFLIVGHCLLALLAAGFGSIVAPVVCDMPRTDVTTLTGKDLAGPVS